MAITRSKQNWTTGIKRPMPDFLRPLGFVGPRLPRVAAVPTVQQYRDALAMHDWHFQRSDDPSAYRAGAASLSRISAMQRQIDPECAIWSEYAGETPPAVRHQCGSSCSQAACLGRCAFFG